jgi:hypothetical protein
MIMWIFLWMCCATSRRHDGNVRVFFLSRSVFPTRWESKSSSWKCWVTERYWLISHDLTHRRRRRDSTMNRIEEGIDEMSLMHQLSVCVLCHSDNRDNRDHFFLSESPHR